MASLLGRLRRLGNRIKPQHAVITFAFVTALASLVLMGFVLDNGQARAEQALKRKAELTAHTISNSVVRSFEGMVGLLGGIADTLAHSPATQNDPEAIKTLLSERRYLSPAINDLLFYDRFGHLISGSRTALAANIPLPDCLNSALAPASDGIYLAEPKPGKIPGEQVRGATLEHHLPLCFSVRDRNGELIGSLVAAVDTAFFARQFAPAQSLGNAQIELYSTDAVLLATTSSRSLLIGGRFPEKLPGIDNWNTRNGSYLRGQQLYSFRMAEMMPLVTLAQLDVSLELDEWLREAALLKALFISLAILSLVAGVVITFILIGRDRMEGEIHLLTTAISTTANSIFITDSRGRIKWVNEAFEKLTGWNQEEVLNQTPSLFNSGHHDPLFFRELWQTVLSGSVWRGRVRNHNRDGDQLLVEQTITPILDNRGRLTHFVAIHEDVTERTRAEQQARYLSRNDELTGLPNRRYLGEQLVTTLEQPGTLALMFIDLDRFKTINDTQGHFVGDEILKLVSERLGQLLGEDALLARLGGDEFAVLLRQVSIRQLENKIRQLIVRISEPFFVEGVSYSLTISIGVTTGSGGETDAASLLRQADLAMFKAKHEGRNTFCFFEPKMDRLIQRHVQLDQGLREALGRDDQLSLRYQPILDAKTLEPVAIEVLTRWKDSQGEWVSPAEFIPVAEDSGLIIEMGRWQLEKLFELQQQWRGTALEALRLSINLSAVQLARDNIAEHLLSRMAQCNISPDHLVVEITETALMTSKQQVQYNLNLLHEAGVRLSIDDFGTGYSSLAYIRDLNASTLKIDRSFVIGIGKSSSDEEIIETMLGLAKNLNINVVAEGVDDPAQLSFLQKAGCDMVQGFLFAQPLTEADLQKYISAKLR